MFNQKEYNKKWRKENPDKVKAQGQRRYVKSRGKILARVKSYYLRKKYNLTQSEIEILLKKIDYKCEICGEKEKSKDRNKKVKRLAVDHNHETGKVRGFLCDRCNRSLGYLSWFEKYNEEITLYLKRYE